MQKEEGYLIGIEREALRCDADGRISTRPHPEQFGNRIENSFITTDFGEAQMELRTPPCSSPERLYEKLYNITKLVMGELNDRGELLWPCSMPCRLVDEDQFLYNDYSGYPEEEAYEKYLAKKYGYRKLCISGVHFNFSVSAPLFSKLCRIFPQIPKELDEAYFRCMRGFIKTEGVFRRIFDASPIDLDGNILSEASFRNSSHGYRNNLEEYIDYSSKPAYIKSLEALINSGQIARAGEVYTSVRAKASSRQSLLHGLKSGATDHIEIRVCDVDPFDICGISRESISFATAFVFYCFVYGDDASADAEFILSQCKRINCELGLGLAEGIEYAGKSLLRNESKANKLRALLSEKGDPLLVLAREYSRRSAEERFLIYPHTKLELSTRLLIRDALMLGIDYRVLNESKSMVEFFDGSKSEIIVQATKTRRDSYIFEYIADDKIYAKELFSKAGLSVPRYSLLTKPDYLLRRETIADELLSKAIVIKPKSTNCGTGVNILSEDSEREDINKALLDSFSYEDEVIIEEYIPGDEYRFFIINGKCRSVVNRQRASVLGDGKHTVRELSEIYNGSPLIRHSARSIKLNSTAAEMLLEKGMTPESIPAENERIWLQRASNASLGGISADFTDSMPERFIESAEKAAALFNAFICGVDIIIPDLDAEEYYILEINDNPGMSVSAFPDIGSPKRLGAQILHELGFETGEVFDGKH